MQVLIPTGRRIQDLVVDTRTKINVRPYCLSVERSKRFGVYFIFKSREQGPTFRSLASKYPTDDPNHPIILRKRSRFTHYYFYIRDEVLGPMVMCVGSFLPFQTRY